MAQTRTPSIVSLLAAEFLGTFILVLFGCGSVHTAVLTGAQSGVWQVAIVWGVAIMLAAYLVGSISGAHLNPAITIALAAWKRSSWRSVPVYVAGQFAGAFLAAAVLFVLYEPFLTAKEKEKGVVRGKPGSELTAMCYGEYFPNPGPMATSKDFYSPALHDEFNFLVSEPVAFAAEVLGTMVLAMVVFGVSDPRNSGGPADRFAPVFVGLTVSVLISIIAPLTQACFNPARDFGPRLFAWLAGWREIALPGPRGVGFLTVYIVAPIVGAVGGAGLYELLVGKALAGRQRAEDLID